MSDEAKPKTAVEELAGILAAEAEAERLAELERPEKEARLELDRRKTFRELKAKLGIDLQRIDTPAGMVAIKRVAADTAKQFHVMALNPAQHGEANTFITLAAVVYPDPDTFAAWVEKYPMMIGRLSHLVGDFAGSDVSAKKA